MLQLSFCLFLLGILACPSALAYPEVYILNATLPMPIIYTSAQYVGANQIYILGGETYSSTKLDTVYRFNITDETVTLVGHLPGQVHTGGSAYIPSEDVILYMGGGYMIPNLIRISLNHSEDTISSTIEGNIGNNDLMFTRVAWDSTRQQGYILGNPHWEMPGQGFFRYDPAVESVQDRAQLISNVWPYDVANVASFYDSVTDKVYFLGGIKWKEFDSLDTIFEFDPAYETLTLLEERLPYADTDGNLVWDQETGTAYMFHDSATFPVLMFFKPTTREVGSIHLEHFMEYSAIRFGMAWVPQLRRIYMFGGNHEEWWLSGTDRIQYIQL